eukprot:CAMPEP_0201701428 /NCGR_PEP_ID=MMETSP0578-20130828/32600_1 /ASSEMBLY_ACC=CAM_ASM_000663 /TAXON_ID=267565 /ORGANISM="Skeletonema grethea, Strain CCMP 1804" /LENGTH=312 /DNA_ID=CAMNT_0048188741 /DNA_START=105 /DNA_END=1040 /DNA_ORIENTATION=-
MAEDDTTTTTKPPILEEVVWRDDLIRWEGGLNVDIQKNSNDDDGDESSDDGQSFLMDPFADPDPFQMFDFDFDLPSNNNSEREEVERVDGGNKDGKANTISLQIKGYKTDAEQVWQSTGLTLWRASHYLCEYQVEHPELFRNTRVLELGAGLGLNGILAWRLSCVGVDTDDDGAQNEKSDATTCEVCITDGDSDALVHLRDNIERNRPITTTSKVSCHQLIWGEESSQKFLQHIAHNQKYNVLLASDIIYSPVIVQPLWETVKTLLEKEDGVFVMAFARRKVPVSIDLVLEKAVEYGFWYELVKEDLEDGIW